jgi:hypothetical protein
MAPPPAWQHQNPSLKRSAAEAYVDQSTSAAATSGQPQHKQLKSMHLPGTPGIGQAAGEAEDNPIAALQQGRRSGDKLTSPSPHQVFQHADEDEGVDAGDVDEAGQEAGSADQAAEAGAATEAERPMTDTIAAGVQEMDARVAAIEGKVS